MPNRDTRVIIRLTEEERETFTNAAARMGLSLSAWLRLCAREHLDRLPREPEPGGIAPGRR